MKSIFISFLLLVACSTITLAQCDKKFEINTSKSENLDSNGVFQDSKDEQTVVKIDKSAITVITDDGNHTMTGVFKVISCDWKVPYKEGKMVINTDLSRDGDSKNFTITIEGKDGKLTLLAESKDMPDRKIRLPIEKFGEVK
jgi:hypothetical protein